MDNLPKDPPDQNNPPPSFGSNFNPHTNPVDPDNPYQQSVNPTFPQTPTPSAPNTPPVVSVPVLSTVEVIEPNSPNIPDYPQYPVSENLVHSAVASHQKRDEHGRFIPEHEEKVEQTTPPPVPASPPGEPNTPNPAPSGAGLPPIIEINQNTQPSSKKDPPLFGFFLTNPVTYLRAFLNKLLKRQMITLRIPVLALIIIMAGVGGGLGGFGIGFKSGINYGLGKLFPNFSPILHRGITAQGIIQKSSAGYYLQANDKNKTLWTLNPASKNVNLSDFEGMKVQIKGNLTPTPNLIEVSEIISFETTPSPSPVSPTGGLTTFNPVPNGTGLPKLYSDIKWEKTQKKVLLFTSGKRRIEEEGIYLESEQLLSIPQAFLDYYTNQLTNSNFKETLNSQDNTGTTITYSKDDLFLTFGVKNIYSGSGDNKKLVGYKAYIEHN